MPNHVQQRLTIIGPKADIDRFIEASKETPPLSGGMDGLTDEQRAQHPDTVPFHFHGVVPLPDNFNKVPYTNEGYHMEHATWGTKWGPYELGEWERDNPIVGVPTATIDFTCAWGPPDKYYAAASAAYPDLMFLVSYGGEGPCYGRNLHSQGETVADDTLLSEQTTDPSEAADFDWDDEKDTEAYWAWERQLIESHPHCVARVITTAVNVAQQQESSS